MSKDSATKFLARMNSDEPFASQVEAADFEQRRQIVKSAGFNFTYDEIEAVASGVSDDTLKDIAGGKARSRPRSAGQCYGRLYGCTNGCEGSTLW